MNPPAWNRTRTKGFTVLYATFTSPGVNSIHFIVIFTVKHFFIADVYLDMTTVGFEPTRAKAQSLSRRSR